MENRIVINQTYFDNIKVAIDAMNQFFASQFKVKSFPVVNKDFQLDQVTAKIVSWLAGIEPQWIENPEAAFTSFASVLQPALAKEPNPADDANMQDAYDRIIFNTNATDPVKSQYYAFISFKVLQYIADHFEQFETLMNGIYTFELFTVPSQYRDAITVFNTPITITELNQFAPHKHEYRIFKPEDYVHGIFTSEFIKLPDTMKEETEAQRIASFVDLQDVEVVVDANTVQEAAAINYFKSTKPTQIVYDTKTNKWKISKQFEKQINTLIKNLRDCQNTDDLAAYFSSLSETEPSVFAENIMPYLYANIFTVKKDQWKNPITKNPAFKNYAKSYKSIIDKNNGAKRFARYDIFSTFRTDKEGTIQFIEDFLKLNLVNNENAVISNSMALTLFNIFDSRIYLDIMYNLIPEDVKKDEYPTEDGFVKLIRARINQNSKKANPYQKGKKTDNTVETSSQVVGEAFEIMRSFDGASESDMKYCQEFAGAAYDEIDALGDIMYNRGVSSIMIDRYIGESYQLTPELMQEGFIAKMKQRSNLKKIERIEKKYQHRLPDLFINLLTHPPRRDKPVKYTNGRGYLGMLFSLNDIASSFNTNFTNVLLDNKLVMFAEFYDTDDLNKEVDDFDEYMRVLYYSLDDGSVMISQNPFNMRSFYKDDIKPFEESLEAFMMHLEDWEGKPDVNPTDDSDDDDDEEEIEEKETEEVETSDDGESEEIEEKSEEEDETVQEQETGDIPSYLKDRINLSDEAPKRPEKKEEPADGSITDFQIPSDVPINDIDDLADSINARLDVSGADSLGDMLGSGYKGNIQTPKHGGPGTVIYNITNTTYTNSTHSVSSVDDHSTGKTTTTTTVDMSVNKRTNTGGKNRSSNNYDNTRPSSNSKESENTFSNGKSVQEVFALLDSKEPLFVESDAGKPPKEDLLTKSMDVDRTTLSWQQKAKRGVQKVGNTGKAILKPIGRVKQWMTKMVDSFIKRDEDRVKAELVDNPSYRSALYKVARIAIKLGLFTVFTNIAPFLGVAYLGVQGMKLADRERLRKEANSEIATEIQIIDQKIEDLKQRRYYGDNDNPSDKEELYKLMRMRAKLVQMSTDVHKRKFANTKSVY